MKPPTNENRERRAYSVLHSFEPGGITRHGYHHTTYGNVAGKGRSLIGLKKHKYIYEIPLSS